MREYILLLSIYDMEEMIIPSNVKDGGSRDNYIKKRVKNVFLYLYQRMCFSFLLK